MYTSFSENCSFYSLSFPLFSLPPFLSARYAVPSAINPAYARRICQLSERRGEPTRTAENRAEQWNRRRRRRTGGGGQQDWRAPVYLRVQWPFAEGSRTAAVVRTRPECCGQDEDGVPPLIRFLGAHVVPGHVVPWGARQCRQGRAQERNTGARDRWMSGAVTWGEGGGEAVPARTAF